MNPIFVLALLAAALSVFAQSYTTVDVYEDCTNIVVGSETITSTIIETTCPLCIGMSQTQTGQYTYTTVYTTVWETLCSTGMTPATYTITSLALVQLRHSPQGQIISLKVTLLP